MNIETLTKEQVNKIFGVIMDSKEQDRLMNNTADKDSWMLDFVYDSKLRKTLEIYSEKLALEEQLGHTMVKEKISKV